jgi:hypothetical protein
MCNADLRDAHVQETDLTGVDLRGAEFNSRTHLKAVKLSNTTRLGDIKWSSASLTQIDWHGINQLGDETLVTVRKRTKDLSRRSHRMLIAQAYSDVARAYHVLVLTLEDQGYANVASRFRVREYTMERRALFTRHRYHVWLYYLMLDVVCGYGERPQNAFGVYLAILTAFAGLYYLLTNSGISHFPALSLWDAVVLSTISFHGRAFTLPGIADPVTRASALEALIGFFLEAVFVATIIRRMFNR